jgi:hypothetical protein
MTLLHFEASLDLELANLPKSIREAFSRTKPLGFHKAVTAYGCKIGLSPAKCQDGIDRPQMKWT